MSSLFGPLTALGTDSITEISIGPPIVTQVSAAVAVSIILPVNTQVPIEQHAGQLGRVGGDKNSEDKDEMLPTMVAKNRTPRIPLY